MLEKKKKLYYLSLQSIEDDFTKSSHEEVIKEYVAKKGISLNAIWYPGLDPGGEKRHKGKNW